MSDPTPFSWDDLSRYREGAAPFPTGYPDTLRTFCSPRDPGVHEVICALLSSARHSVVLNMYGFDDDDANKILLGKMQSENVFVQMSLDKSQAGGVHERELLKGWPSNVIGTSVAVGNSVKHAIAHLKVCVVDGIYTMQGSTNWSLSGEQKQDNELTIVQSAVYAAERRTLLDINHNEMLRQMQATKP